MIPLVFTRLRCGLQCVILLTGLTCSAAEPFRFSRADLTGYGPLDGDFRNVLGRHQGSYDSGERGPAVFVNSVNGQALDQRGGDGHVDLSLALGPLFSKPGLNRA